MIKAMKWLAIAAALNFTHASMAHSQDFGGTVMSVDDAKSVYLKCGKAIVWVIGTQADSTGPSMRMVQGGYIHAINRTDKGFLEKSFIDKTSVLNDYNEAVCIADRSGLGHDRFVVRGHCGGSACPDDFEYSIIDLSTMTIELPKGAKAQDGCDAKCFIDVIGHEPSVYFD